MKNKPTKVLELPNRYEYKNKLVYGSDTAYLILDKKSIYSRVITQGSLFDDDNVTISAVDPEGGPYISIGYPVGNKEVSSITSAKDVYYENEKVSYIFKLS